MIKIFYTFVDENMTRFPVEKLAPFPKDIQERIMRYMGFRERVSSLVGKLLLLKGLIDTDAKDAIKTLHYDDLGKPHIKGEINFSISHSDKCVSCAVAKNEKVGFDIEKIRNVRLSDFKNHLLPEQYASVNKSGDMSFFFRCWTQNESLLKGDGRGFRANISNLKKEKDGTVIINDTKWFLSKVNIHPDYAATIATTLKNPVIKLEEIIFSKIIKDSYG